MSYRCPAVSRQYAQAVANTLRNIIETVVSDPGLTIDKIDFVSDDDKEKMISWNPKVPYAQMTCMHYLVESVARAIPSSEAICAWDGSATYAQLNALSSIAAQQLVRAGVGPGTYVPFAYEKSLWTVVATFAILKAGGAFVPLDPTHPRARLREILNSINATVVVTSDLFASSMQGLAKHVIVIAAKTVSRDQSNEIKGFCAASVGPKDPIFVLFTSGSTGKPKGMIHEHGAICTHAITHGEAMGYHGARVLQFAAHTFDVAIIDIFTTLIFGGCICIPSEEDRRSNIVGVINSMKADYAILTPSFAGLIEPSDVPTLKTLAIGGEALPQDRIQRWAERVSLIQIYGPAEVGICLIMHMHSRSSPETVGYPLPNSSCWLVDPDNPHCLVPIGAVGELVVAGPSLARSYLNDEIKTRSCFLEDLDWADQIGLKCGRFYRTGDLLRYNTNLFDGAYDFVGRKDAQIKLRGQRIEPGEIEYHIASIPGVAVSMVTRPERGCFAGELVSVVQMRGAESSCVLSEPISIALDQSLSIEAVGRHLVGALPGYMVPTVCIVVDNMPFVPSLKINRKLVDNWLTDMTSRPSEVLSATLNDLRASFLDPDEATAKLLNSKIVELVACKDEVRELMLKRRDFVLQKSGIDSIQIISLSIFMQKEFRIKIPMHQLLNSTTTIRDLAYLIDHRNESSTASTIHATVDVAQEVRILSEKLFRDIKPHRSNGDSATSVPIRNVFLTGASGYLGTTILQQLVAKPDLQIFCLVRCSTEPAGFQRIKETGIKTGWWQDCYASRIQVWRGDLTEDDFGLDSRQLDCLYGTVRREELHIHAIIHNGAKVHYSSDYQTLKAPNVHPTSELLKITAQAAKISSFVFVSGGRKPSVQLGNEEESESHRSDAAADHIDQADGYAQTKHVSEQLVRNCVGHTSFQSKRLYTIKPGYIVGSRQAGIANQTDFIWRLIAGCVEIGAYNHDEAAHWLLIADVDCVARRVVSGVCNDAASHRSGHVEKVLEGLRFAELWEMLGRDFGYDLERLGYDEWMGRLKEAIMKKREEHLLFPLMHVLERDGGSIGSREIPVGVKSEGMKEVIRSNVKRLIEVGFLPSPEKSSP